MGTPLTGLLPNPGTQSPPEIRYELNKNEIVTQLTLYYIAPCRGRMDDLQRMRNLHRIKSKYELRIKIVPKIEFKAKNLKKFNPEKNYFFFFFLILFFFLITFLNKQ